MSDKNKRELAFRENQKAIREYKEAQIKKDEEKQNAIIESNNRFMNNYYKTIDKRRANERKHGRTLDEAKDYYFGNAIKGIYIGALEAATLTDDSLYLAENMVDNYIKESGGYKNIISNVKVDTYALAKIRRVVEDAAEEDIKEEEKAEEEIDDINDDVELQNYAEDEVNDVEVEDNKETQLTTANITDIVSALNQAGLEVVKKGEDADNFKEGQPEESDTKPEEVEAEVDVEETPSDAEPTTDAAPAEADGAEELDDNELEDDINSADQATTEAPATDDAAPSNPEEEPTIDAKPEEEVEAEVEIKDDETPSEEDAEEEKDELDQDLEDAEEVSEDDEEEEDTLDPDSITVNPDDDSTEEDEELDIEDEDEEDIDDINGEEDDEEEIEDIDIDGDGEEDIGDVDEPEETVNVDPNKTMMDELENEKEIQAAVELIRTRVADAEEAFIKRNQEDKKKIDDLLSKISQNVSTVEKIADNDSDQAKNLEEATMMYRRKINEMDLKPMSIFDKMARNIAESVIKNPNTIEKFVNESTKAPDFGLITETAKVMYAFLETLNTLQLEEVDGAYISKVLAGQI